MFKKLWAVYIVVSLFLINTPVVQVAYAESLGPGGGDVNLGENIIMNPGFEEEINGIPAGFDLKGIPKGVICSADSSNALSGAKSLELTSGEPAHAYVVQRINAKPDTYYRIKFNVLPQNIKNRLGAPHLAIYYGNSPEESTKKYLSTEMMDTEGYWSGIGFYIKTLKDVNEPLNIALVLGGGQGDKNSGTAFFDDISMQQVENPENLKEFEIVKFTETGIMAPTASGPLGTSGGNPIVYSVAAGIILIALVSAGYIFFKKRRI